MSLKSANLTLNKDEMTAIIKQKPNRYILGTFRFYLGAYNFSKIGKKQGKFKQWIGKTIGEEPVLLDTLLTERSRKQLSLYLNKKGYFDNIVTDTTIFRNKKAHVIYRIQTGEAYRLSSVNYDIIDSGLVKYITADTVESLLKSGRIFDESVLLAEQQRLTNKMRNAGYYQFQKEHIFFQADTTRKTKQVKLLTVITDRNFNVVHPGDSIFMENHKLFVIEKVNIYPEYNFQQKEHFFSDTLFMTGNATFYYNKVLKYKPRALLNPLFVNEGDLFSQTNVERTYERYTSMNNFRSVNITFDYTKESFDKGFLDANLRFLPRKKQSYSIAAEGTNSSGNLGISGTVSYQNLNILRGAEIFEIKLRGGIEAQQLAVTIEDNSIAGNIPLTNRFNTIELGPEFNFTVPRMVFPYLSRTNIQRPRSTLTSAFNYQRRPDYTRIVLTGALNYTGRTGKYLQHFYSPVDINYVWIQKSTAFENSLREINDILIKQSYTNLLIPSFFKYSMIYSNQERKVKRNHHYFRATFETSGNIISAIRKLSGEQERTIVIDGAVINGYTVFNLPYSQYFRTELDYRRYLTAGINRLVLRANVGLAVPYGNSDAMPFIKSFFGGGTNDIRAWTARTLGPGIFPRDSEGSFEQIGDIKVEGNIEYRYNVFKSFNGAFFLDFGNIWMLRNDSLTNRPGGQFNITKFYKQLAYGAGIGLRYDFSFFIIRLDLAVPVQDPGKPGPDKFVLTGTRFSDIRPNLGIGYPF